MNGGQVQDPNSALYASSHRHVEVLPGASCCCDYRPAVGAVTQKTLLAAGALSAVVGTFGVALRESMTPDTRIYVLTISGGICVLVIVATAVHYAVFRKCFLPQNPEASFQITTGMYVPRQARAEI